MRTIAYHLDIGYCGCDDRGETEVPDDFTNAQIDALVEEMAQEHASSWEGDERLGWSDEMTKEEHEQETSYFYENVEGSWHFVEQPNV